MTRLSRLKYKKKYAEEIIIAVSNRRMSLMEISRMLGERFKVELSTRQIGQLLRPYIKYGKIKKYVDKNRSTFYFK